MRYPHRSHHRPGNVLVWFALMVWVLVCVAALTIDLGLVRTTQEQMQLLTDEAALEAAYQLDGSASDRQVAAQGAIGTATSDTQTSDHQRFGAGPTITLSTGDKDLGDGFTAPAMLTNPSAADPSRNVYKPALAANSDNAQDGDIVRGFPKASTKTVPEAADYSRDDFTPDGAGDAILVRLRRSHESFATGDAAKSAGPALPYLFARGSLMSSQGKGQGVTIRATSIAAARPVLTAGPTLPPSPAVPDGLPGVAPFGLLLSSPDPSVPTWQSWRKANPTATTLTASVDATGAITGNVTGAFMARPAGVTLIGQLFTPAGTTTPLMPLDSYVPLYDTVGGSFRFVGFLNAPGLTLSGTTLTLPLSTTIAAGNASASFSPGAAANPLAGLVPADLSSLFSFTTSGGSTDLLRAPALVR